ncbi:MAG: penicillin-binding protein 2 [Mucinivorans sp.]
MEKEYARYRTLFVVLVVVVVVIIARLFYIQVVDGDYKESARNNALRFQVQFPPRGEVYDRNGEFLVQSKESYDLVVIPRDVEPFDTLRMAETIGVSLEQFSAEFHKASSYSRRKPSVLYKQLPKEVKLRLDERRVKGFYTQYRTVRTYPRKVAGNLLGYVSEVNDRIIQKDSYYRMGDYIGMSGIEQAYEQELRGKKGVKVEMVDVYGRPQGTYQHGRFDTLSEPGKAIVSTLDARLQAMAEELMTGKIGAVVAIEPATGEILVMASSPSYDPDLLVGRERGNNYMRMVNTPTKPLFNRAVMARYPPGSTFKVVNGLIGMQQGVATPEDTFYPCSGGYPYGRGVGCHHHASPLNMITATANSCNAYFCYVLRDLLENRKVGNISTCFDLWREYVLSFGFGRKLDSDFIGELNGYVPTSEHYNKVYRNQWSALTVISLSIGQGELGTTPLQMANLSATIANRGYYMIPHVVKKIEGRDSIDARFYKKHYTRVEPRYFDPIVEGMYQAVNVAGTASVARVEGLDICGKTGTAQNPRGADHSVFMSFAPRNNPKIAIVVYVEHGRWGATAAAPIASLLTEQYLTDTITRTAMYENIKAMEINYPMYQEKLKSDR